MEQPTGPKQLSDDPCPLSQVRQPHQCTNTGVHDVKLRA